MKHKGLPHPRSYFPITVCMSVYTIGFCVQKVSLEISFHSVRSVTQDPKKRSTALTLGLREFFRVWSFHAKASVTFLGNWEEIAFNGI